jgi:hypothetical protein
MVIGGDNQVDKYGLVGGRSDRGRGRRKLDRERREIEGFGGKKREIGWWWSANRRKQTSGAGRVMVRGRVRAGERGERERKEGSAERGWGDGERERERGVS